MKASAIQIGLRVTVASNKLTALIVGTPEYYTPRSHLVRIKYENSTRYEYMISNQLIPLPTEQQYAALGGSYTKPKGDS